MPLTAPERLARAAAAPRLVRLWRALQSLRTTVSFLQSGAHPDDETSALLAALGWRDGIDIAYVCATRGEGGQNAIGPETGEALGVLRTAEMAEAARRLGLRLYWLSEGPGHPISDFGFSRSGTDTLARWGRDRTVARFAEVLRRERPDILCPTFLDVPGQHGHHRAMTEAAHAACARAADPAVETPGLAPWSVPRLCLPAWSGAGTAYDDDLPPPPPHFTIPGGGTDPVTGLTYAQIGEHARAAHRSQSMGRWIAPGTECDWPLHVAHGSTESLTAGLPLTLTDLDVSALTAPLAEAQSAIDTARAAFPDGAEIAAQTARALTALAAAIGACPSSARPHILHRLTRKRAQLAETRRLALGITLHAWTETDILRPGQPTAFTLHTTGPATATLALPEGWQATGTTLTPGKAAAGAPKIRLRIDSGGTVSETLHDFEIPPAVLPARTLTPIPATDIVNRAAPRRQTDIALTPPGARPGLDLPEGWHAAPSETGLTLTLPQDPEPGLTTLPLTLDGAPARSAEIIGSPPYGPSLLTRPAVLRVRVLDAALPRTRLAILSGTGTTAHWLARLGADVTLLAATHLTDPQTLARFTTVVIGPTALAAHSGLSMTALHDWIAAGGTLLTLYHRPWDNWDAESTPPRRLEIGQPSLRWRVTDPAAPVTPLLPDDPLLTTPNRIGPGDWAGWVRERGLYFAARWDAAYRPLLALCDPGEPPLHGALLAAEIGAGRHVHTALALHRQMDALVPGAFRLMANLIAPRR